MALNVEIVQIIWNKNYDFKTQVVTTQIPPYWWTPSWKDVEMLCAQLYFIYKT